MQENGTELLVCCTGCQSCMPCMVKINIPGLFALYNRTATEGVEAVRAEYERQDKRADDCINCYRCEKQCPQHLGIGILMQDIAEKCPRDGFQYQQRDSFIGFCSHRENP